MKIVDVGVRLCRFAVAALSILIGYNSITSLNRPVASGECLIAQVLYVITSLAVIPSCLLGLVSLFSSSRSSSARTAVFFAIYASLKPRDLPVVVAAASSLLCVVMTKWVANDDVEGNNKLWDSVNSLSILQSIDCIVSGMLLSTTPRTAFQKAFVPVIPSSCRRVVARHLTLLSAPCWAQFAGLIHKDQKSLYFIALDGVTRSLLFALSWSLFLVVSNPESKVHIDVERWNVILFISWQVLMSLSWLVIVFVKRILDSRKEKNE